jgi:hypothetical protein
MSCSRSSLDTSLTNMKAHRSAPQTASAPTREEGRQGDLCERSNPELTVSVYKSWQRRAEAGPSRLPIANLEYKSNVVRLSGPRGAMSEDFLYVAAVILLPLIPAFIIFRLMNNIPAGNYTFEIHARGDRPVTVQISVHEPTTDVQKIEIP